MTAVQYDRIVEALLEENLSVIICKEYSDRTIANTILRESGREGLQILSLHSCHTLTPAAIRDGQTYLSLMRQNLEILRIALN